MKALLLCALLLAGPAFAANAGAGRYQAVLGDCAGCHGRDMAGGVVLATPFGTLVTPNITPDRDTGIGGWSADQFRAAMTRGVAPGGKLLYPAMPYPAYAHMPDRDIADLWAYLRTVKPVYRAVDANRLRFPFNIRLLMRGWNLLFFRPAPLADVPGKSAAWTRGRYLVEGPGHCGTCHTPKNLLGADKGAALSGAVLQGWYAPNLTGDAVTGLGRWRKAELVAYLKTGRNDRSIASGPMAEVVENSTALMRDSDLDAIATYLKDLGPAGGSGGGVPHDDTQIVAGRAVYRLSCAACHGMDGKGSAIFPPLAGSATVQQASAETLARVVLAGTKGAATKGAPTGPGMPSFSWKLDDAAVANVLTFVRNDWGNAAPAVDAGLVERVRASK